MNNKRVVYPDEDGGVLVLTPLSECGLTLEEIIAKDVPAGRPYTVIDVSQLPSDRMFRNAWQYVEPTE